MIMSNKKFKLYNSKILIIIIYIQIIFTNCDDFFIDLHCLYPRSFNLYNGNILLVCSDGIYTYNSNFKQKLYSKEFDNELTSTEADFVSIKQYPNNGNAIVITKNSFYFLSPEGKVISEDSFTLDNSGLYYTLALFIYDNNLNFVIGNINTDCKLNIAYYKINKTTNKIELITNYSPTVKTGFEGKFVISHINLWYLKS